MGYNMYTAYYVTSKVSSLTPVGYYADQDIESTQDPDWGRWVLSRKQ